MKNQSGIEMVKLNHFEFQDLETNQLPAFWDPAKPLLKVPTISFFSVLYISLGFQWRCFSGGSLELRLLVLEGSIPVGIMGGGYLSVRLPPFPAESLSIAAYLLPQ